MRARAAAVVVLVALCGCGDDAETASAVEVRCATGESNTRVLQIEQSIGHPFATSASEFAMVPDVTLYDDGRLLVTSDDDSGGGLILTEVDCEELQGFVRRAVEIGLHQAELDVGNTAFREWLADANSTVFRLYAGGESTGVNVYALGNDDDASSRQRERRVALSALEDDLLERGRDGGVAYEPASLSAWVEPYAPYDDGDPETVEPDADVVDWPLGLLVPTGDEGWCIGLSAADRAVVKDAAGGGFVAWQSDGASYSVTFRPDLPHEAPCASLEADD